MQININIENADQELKKHKKKKNEKHHKKGKKSKKFQAAPSVFAAVPATLPVQPQFDSSKYNQWLEKVSKDLGLPSLKDTKDINLANPYGFAGAAVPPYGFQGFYGQPMGFQNQ